jgi:hypothetical protein
VAKGPGRLTGKRLRPDDSGADGEAAVKKRKLGSGVSHPSYWPRQKALKVSHYHPPPPLPSRSLLDLTLQPRLIANPQLKVWKRRRGDFRWLHTGSHSEHTTQCFKNTNLKVVSGFILRPINSCGYQLLMHSFFVGIFCFLAMIVECTVYPPKSGPFL